MNRLIPICISMFFCSLLYGQKDSIIWHLSGQTNDQTVKAYFVSSKKDPKRNVLIFKRGQLWDTLDMSEYTSLLPGFKDTCVVQSIQLDGNGLPEVMLYWEKKSVYNNSMDRYRFHTIWDLDTRQRIFYITSDYYASITEKTYGVDGSDKIVDSIVEQDSCIYTCDFKINADCQIVITNTKQVGRCPYNGLFKRGEGIYYYEDKKLQWKKLSGGE